MTTQDTYQSLTFLLCKVTDVLGTP